MILRNSVFQGFGSASAYHEPGCVMVRKIALMAQMKQTATLRMWLVLRLSELARRKERAFLISGGAMDRKIAVTGLTRKTATIQVGFFLN